MNNDNIIAQKESQNNSDNIPMPLFFKLFVFVGILMVFFGTKSLINNIVKTKDYLETTGTCISFNKYKNDDGYTYYAVFEYLVNDKKYTIEDNTMNKNTKIGISRKVKYNAENPQEAIVSGPSYSIFVIFLGLFFLFIIIMIWYGQEKLKALLFGFFFTLIGVLIPTYLLIAAPDPNLRLKSIFTLNNLIFIFFSLIFLILGVYILLVCIIQIISPKTAEKIKQKVTLEIDNAGTLFRKLLPVIYIKNMILSLLKIILALIVGIFLCISPIIFKIEISIFITTIVFEGFGLILIGISLTNIIKIYKNYKNNNDK